MANQSEITLEGFDDVIEALDNLVTSGNTQQVLGKACAIIERSAKEKAPKGDGDLRRSIKSRITNDTGEVYTPLEYAPYVEFGTGLFAEEGGRKDVPWVYCDDEGKWHTTSGMHPSPYMRPALYENKEKILRVLREGLINNG